MLNFIGIYWWISRRMENVVGFINPGLKRGTSEDSFSTLFYYFNKSLRELYMSSSPFFLSDFYLVFNNRFIGFAGPNLWCTIFWSFEPDICSYPSLLLQRLPKIFTLKQLTIGNSKKKHLIMGNYRKITVDCQEFSEENSWLTGYRSLMAAYRKEHKIYF